MYRSATFYLAFRITLFLLFYITLFLFSSSFFPVFLQQIVYQNNLCTPCFRKKLSTHIIGYKLKNSCLMLIIFDIKIPHIIYMYIA